MEAADVGVLEKIGPPLGLVWELVGLGEGDELYSGRLGLS